MASVNQTQQEMPKIQEVDRRAPRDRGYGISSPRTVGLQGLTLNLSGPTHSFVSDPAERDGAVLSSSPDWRDCV